MKTIFFAASCLLLVGNSKADLLATASVERHSQDNELPSELYFSFRMCEGASGCSSPISGIGFWEIGPLNPDDVGREFEVNGVSTTILPIIQFDRLTELLTNGSGDLFMMGVSTSPGFPLDSGAGVLDQRIFFEDGPGGAFRWNTTLEVPPNSVVDLEGYEIDSIRMRIDALEPGLFGMTLEFHSIPEPGSLILTLIAMLCSAIRRTR